MNKREAKQNFWEIGFDRGVGAATYMEVGPGESAVDAAFAAELHSRDFSPFEFTARDINNYGEYAEVLWEAYEKGVEDGITKVLGEL